MLLPTYDMYFLLQNNYMHHACSFRLYVQRGCLIELQSAIGVILACLLA